MPDRITEAKLKNKRFEKTETAILMAFSSVRENISISRLIRIARISRATLYRHHHTVHNIVPDYEKYILRQYKTTIRRLLRIKNIHLKSLYIRTFTFIIAHKKIIHFLSQHSNKDLIRAMLSNLQSKVFATGKMSNPEIFAIYVGEVAIIIEQWMYGGFDKEEIPSAVDKIMYLTNTAHERLGPIASQ